MELSTIQRISNWAVVIVLLIGLFVLGGYTTCKLSDGNLLPDLSCTNLRELDLCVFDDKIYVYNDPFIDLNLTTEEINKT